MHYSCLNYQYLIKAADFFKSSFKSYSKIELRRFYNFTHISLVSILLLTNFYLLYQCLIHIDLTENFMGFL
jgi:hypothetical protein